MASAAADSPVGVASRVATSTVEDYLKGILKLQGDAEERPVATGAIAGALGVAPGTVTSMMKTLSDGGLVAYEPYSGVRLTPAGRRLATHVLRRHRLIELFLVQVMGMDWSRVHAEAERLEHAVSDELVERMDSMLGHPTADPHGDPIPTRTGEVEEPDLQSLATCRTSEPLRVARVTDQEADFLRLVERTGLMPGSLVTVVERNPAADTVVLEPEPGGALSLGMTAARKILVADR